MSAKRAPSPRYEWLYDEDEDKFVLRCVTRKLTWLDVLKQCPGPMDDISPHSREVHEHIMPLQFDFIICAQNSLPPSLFSLPELLTSPQQFRRGATSKNEYKP